MFDWLAAYLEDYALELGVYKLATRLFVALAAFTALVGWLTNSLFLGGLCASFIIAAYAAMFYEHYGKR